MARKVEMRDDCKECGKELPNARFRTYCSATCRNKANNRERAEYSLNWQRQKRANIASTPSDKKCQCLICGLWYVQICTHAFQVHGLTGREYREHFDLEVKKGIVPEWYRKLKGDQALDNETYKNLEKGAKYRFKKGDTEAGKYTRSHITVERLKKQIKNLHKPKK